MPQDLDVPVVADENVAGFRSRCKMPLACAAARPFRDLDGVVSPAV